MVEWKATGWTVIGWSLVILMILVAASMIGAWVEKKYPGNGCDERQKLIRGEAYRFSFWIGLLLDMGLYIWLHLGQAFPLEMETVMAAGLLIQMVVFHLYCLVKKMELPLARRGWWTVACYAVIAVMNVRSFCGNLDYAEAYQLYAEVYPDTTLEPGIVGEDTYLMLAIGVAFAALAVIHLIQLLWQQEEEG